MPEATGTQTRSATSYEIRIGGTTFRQPEDQGLETVVVEDHVDMVSLLSVRLGGTEGQPEWGFQVGDEVEARLGDGNVLLFKGHVTALEPSFGGGSPTTLVLRALDPIHKLGRGRKTRFWEQVTDSDIVKEVGAECGLSVEADATEETMAYVIQRNESNVAFLKRLAARNNFLLRVDEGTLVFRRNQYAGEEIELAFGQNLRTLNLQFNSVDQVSEVVVRGWDIMAKEEIVGTASSSDVTPVGGGDLGLVASDRAFGASTAYITDVPVSTQGQADAIARAELERLARQFVRGTGVIQGDDRVRAGTRVRFSGLNSPWDGVYYVVASRHIISNRTGYTTEFTLCSNSFGS